MNHPLQRDITLLFSTRIIRLFCYGFLSVILALYLAETGFDEKQIGLLFTFTFAGDAGISLWLTTSADRFGRKRTLLIGALLMLGAGIIFILTNNIIILMVAAIIGVISPSGHEIGPFLSVEQAGLTQLIANEKRTKIFAWYNMVGSFATATGALAGGWLAQILQGNGWTQLGSLSPRVDGLWTWRNFACSFIPGVIPCHRSDTIKYLQLNIHSACISRAM